MNAEGNTYALIYAGGGGTRLWPLSREKKPKQFLKLFSERTLLQETYDRIKPEIPFERIFVLTNASYEKQVRENLPEIPEEQILLEPVRRSTAPAAFLGALAIYKKDPGAIIANIWADHKIENQEEYLKTIKAGTRAVADGKHLLATGLKPTFPHTGLGYIKKGKKQKTEDGVDIFKLERFVEKPDVKTAEDMLDEGGYLWNVGLFIWRADAILRSFEKHAPEIAKHRQALSRALGSKKALAQIFQKMPEISIDYAIAEKAGNFLVAEAKFDWSDIGDFEVLWEEISKKDEKGNVFIGKNGATWVGVNTQGGIMISENGQLIATVGLTNLAVIATRDAILVIPRDDAQKIKELAKKLRKDYL